MKNNVVGWFEIPVIDMERAIKFYETVFDFKLSRNQLGKMDMAWFPMKTECKGAAGSLVKYEEWYKPSHDGVLIYFSSTDIQVELSKIVSAGGVILVHRRMIAEDIGFMAVFIDTEGNRIALHSQK